MAPPVKFALGTSSAPVSPTLRDVQIAEDNGGLLSVPKASNTAIIQESASETHLPAVNTNDGLEMHEDVKQNDFAVAARQHHHHHHREPHAAPIHYNPYAAARPAYSLGGAHAYDPRDMYANPYAIPKGARRSGQRQVQGLGRAMPTWEEMQLRKALKAEKMARHAEHQARRSGGHTPRTAKDSTPSLALTNLTAPDTDIHQAMAEMHAAMARLTSLLPEGYLPSGTATPYALTPAASRTASRAPILNEKGGELKQVTSHDSDGSSSSSSSDSEDEEEEKANPLARFRHFIREPAAEFLGTAILILFGNGVNNQFFLSMNADVSTVVRGTYTSVSWSWGIGVAMGVYVSGGISGGHLNPAVTLALAVYRRFPWRKLIPFWIAQILGAMTGAALVSLIYQNAVSVYEGGGGIRTVTGMTSTANLYTTFKLPYVSYVGAFFNEFLDTAILLCVIFAIGDSNNTPPPDGLNPIVLLFLIFGIGASLGSQTAYAINPARDIGPRLMLWMRGYGTSLWTTDAWYWLWCPVLAPLTGALAGGLVYDLFIFTGSESPLNQKWEWRWSKRNKTKFPKAVGPADGAQPQENAKMPAGGDRQDV